MLAMEARDDLNLDIYAVVANMREARSTMVQTLIQYAFLFRTVEEVLDKTLCNLLTENARRNSKTASKPVSFARVWFYFAHYQTDFELGHCGHQG